jgi:hypothetical protein
LSSRLLFSLPSDNKSTGSSLQQTEPIPQTNKHTAKIGKTRRKKNKWVFEKVNSLLFCFF